MENSLFTQLTLFSVEDNAQLTLERKPDEQNHKAYSYTTPVGHLRCTEISTADFRAVKIQLLAKRNRTIRVQLSGQPFYALVYNLYDELQCSAGANEKEMVFQFQQALVFSLQTFEFTIRRSAWFYQFFILCYEPRYIESLNILAEIPAFAKKARAGKPALLSSPLLASPQAIWRIHGFDTIFPIDPPTYQEKLYPLLREFVNSVRFHSSVGDDSIPDEQMLRLQRARRYLMQHTHKKMERYEVEKRFKISPAKFNKWFRQLNGLNAKDFIIRERMEDAMVNLSLSPRALTTTAKSVGYENKEALFADFKRYLKFNDPYSLIKPQEKSFLMLMELVGKKAE